MKFEEIPVKTAQDLNAENLREAPGYENFRLQVGTFVRQIRILKVLSRGGMGEIYLGFDEKLQRQVALKAIHPETFRDTRARRRFLREARMLSQLDHPNICRIYDYIEGEDRDVLVLELIEGRTLTVAQREELSFAERLAIADKIVQALMVAHARGIIHRDLKPENIMQCTDGSIKVVDFGLAFSEEEVMSDEIRARRDSDTTAIETLSVHGTLAYMSPEQLRNEEITPASDLYSLGLLLQELFTGRPAYPELNFYDLVLQVEKAQTVPVEGVQKDLKSLIESLKSREPQDRPSAREAAARLRQVAEAPRRRLRLAGAALVLASASLGGLKYTIDLRHEKQQAVFERERAEGLVEFMLDDLFESLDRVGRLDVLDQVAVRSLRHYDAFPDLRLSPEGRARHGLAFLRVGRVLAARGNLDAAIAMFRRAQKIHEELIALDPERAEWRLHLADDRSALAWAQFGQGDLELALETFHSAEEIHLSLAAQAPEDLVLVDGLARNKSAMSNLLALLGKHEESRLSLKESGILFQRLMDEEPDRLDWSFGLAVHLSNLGDVHMDEEDWQGAIELFDQARGISQRLMEGEPNNPHWQFSLVQDEVSYGQALHSKGELEAAREALQRATSLAQKLLVLDPTNVDWQYRFAVCLTARGDLLTELGELNAALTAYEGARDISRQLAERDPTSTDWQLSLAWDHYLVGTALAALERNAQARATYAEALEIVQRLLARSGDRSDALGLTAEIEASLLELS